MKMKPVMYYLFNQNCLDGINTLPSTLFQCIIADIPYLKTQNTWESEIPLSQLWQQLIRLITPTGTIIFFTQQDFTTDIINSQRNLFRYELIWVKEKPTLFFEAKHRFLPIHENILIFSLNYPNTYYPQMYSGKPYKKKKYAIAQGTNYNLDSVKEYTTINKGERYPSSILYFPRDNANKGIHPTQKPLGLLELLILSFTQSNEYVLDICSGSGTTCIACLKHQRISYNYETDLTYYHLSQARIQSFLNYHEDRYQKPLKIDKSQTSLQYLIKK